MPGATAARAHPFARLAAALLAWFGLAGGVAAECLPVAGTAPVHRFASLPSPGEVRLTFLGHASFLIETPGGASAVTDYNGVIAPPYLPDVVTMNNAHSTHYTDDVDPEIAHVLRGWATGEQIARHDITVDDMRVYNVPTNVRDFGGTRYNGNSIFVFEAAGLCIAHLGHLHHPLTDEHLAALGLIDVLLAPIDGTYTMGHDVLLQVIAQIEPAVIIPMHYFGATILERFLALMRPSHEIALSDSATATLSRLTLPQRTVLVLPGI